MKLTVAIGADHGGFSLKSDLVSYLGSQYKVTDFGADKLDPNDDYPQYALEVAIAVASGKAKRGIIICGSGIGASIVANKVKGIRAGLCHDTYSAHQGVEHDDMNVLCLGARVVGPALARELVTTFLNAIFIKEARHQRRLDMIADLERQCFKD